MCVCVCVCVCARVCVCVRVYVYRPHMVGVDINQSLQSTNDLTVAHLIYESKGRSRYCLHKQHKATLTGILNVALGRGRQHVHTA